MNGKRITRSRTDRLVAGVAGGLGAYLGVDPLFVRIGFLVLGLMNGFGLVLYTILWVLIPNEDSIGDPKASAQEALNEMQRAFEQAVERVRTAFTR